MAELLPEFWALLCGEEDSKKASSCRPKQITDFHTWLQCFALYCGVLGRQEATAIPELMAYTITISRAHQEFAGLAWVRYDTAFRRNAAVTGNRKWSAINSSIYSLCFTGKAAVATRCDLCLSTGHGTKSCPLQEDTDPDLPIRLKAVETAVLSLAGQAKGEFSGIKPKPVLSGQVCRLFNEDACRYKNCRHTHQCSICGDQHKAMYCPRNTQSRSGPIPTPQASRQGRREGFRPY